MQYGVAIGVVLPGLHSSGGEATTEELDVVPTVRVNGAVLLRGDLACGQRERQQRDYRPRSAYTGQDRPPVPKPIPRRRSRVIDRPRSSHDLQGGPPLPSGVILPDWTLHRGQPTVDPHRGAPPILGDIAKAVEHRCNRLLGGFGSLSRRSTPSSTHAPRAEARAPALDPDPAALDLQRAPADRPAESGASFEARALPKQVRHRSARNSFPRPTPRSRRVCHPAPPPSTAHKRSQPGSRRRVRIRISTNTWVPHEKRSVCTHYVHIEIAISKVQQHHWDRSAMHVDKDPFSTRPSVCPGHKAATGSIRMGSYTSRNSGAYGSEWGSYCGFRSGRRRTA